MGGEIRSAFPPTAFSLSLSLPQCGGTMLVLSFMPTELTICRALFFAFLQASATGMENVSRLKVTTAAFTKDNRSILLIKMFILHCYERLKMYKRGVIPGSACGTFGELREPVLQEDFLVTLFPVPI